MVEARHRSRGACCSPDLRVVKRAELDEGKVRQLREMFDHTLLDKCTKRLDCADAFPQVFDKVKPEAGIVDLAAEVAAEEEAAAKKGGWFGGMANGGAKLEAAKKARAAASPAGARASPHKNGHNGHVNGEKKNGRNNGIHA